MLAPIPISDGIFNFPLIPPLKHVPQSGSFCLIDKSPSSSTIGLFTTICISIVCSSIEELLLTGTAIDGSGIGLSTLESTSTLSPAGSEEETDKRGEPLSPFTSSPKSIAATYENE